MKIKMTVEEFDNIISNFKDKYKVIAPVYHTQVNIQIQM